MDKSNSSRDTDFTVSVLPAPESSPVKKKKKEKS